MRPLHWEFHLSTNLFPPFLVKEFHAGEESEWPHARFYPFSREVASCLKLQASPLEHLPFASHWKQSLSPLCAFPLLLVFASVPVAVPTTRSTAQ